MAIVYKCTRTSTGEVYIGCTVTGLRARLNNHIVEARRGKSGKLLDALRADGIEGFECAVVQSFDSHQDALAMEARLIAEMSLCVQGLNTRPGGATPGGRSRTDDEREHLRSKAHEWQSNRVGWGEEIGTKLKKFYDTDEGKAQLARRKESLSTPTARANMSRAHGGKPIEVLKDGKVIATYVSQGECARELNILQGNLNNCLRNRPGCKSLRGHTFRYAETPAAGV